MFIKIKTKGLKQVMSKSNIHIASTITMCVVMTFIVFVLGTFITDRYKTVIIPKDLYFPQFTVVTKTHSSSIYLCHGSSSSSAPSPTHVVQFTDSSGFVDLWHSMSDKELIEKATRVPRTSEHPHKLAFMFLTRGSLPLGPFWEKFFKGHEGLFSIYLHTSPDFIYEPPNSSVFYKRKIPSQV